ncbi:AAA family ATPase [Viscerimonas tarda]
MITRIEIDGFKSFKNFVMEFTPLTVIAGANASGKSNLFDALQLLSRLAEVDLRTAFGEQRGDASELFLKYDDNTAAQEITFAVEMLVDKKIRDNWGGEAELKYTRLRYEIKIARRNNEKGFEDLFVVHESLVNLRQGEDKWINIIDKDDLEYWRPKAGHGGRGVYIETKDHNGISSFVVSQDLRQGNTRTYAAIEAKQSLLSGITTVDFRHILAAREEMRNWKFLQFNPEDLREPTRQEPNASDMISHSGKNLAAALFRIKQEDEYSLIEISRKLNTFLPEFIAVEVLDDRANKQFIIKLKGEDGRVFSSRVLSEGTLRLLALCILLYDDQHKSVLCFEEPENGIHPCRIQSMIDLLKELSTDFKDKTVAARQVIVNTHSPVLVGEILNWEKDKYVSIWFANTNTRMTDFNNQKYRLKATKMVPVIKDAQAIISGFSNLEKNLTLAEVKSYLNTSNFSSNQN